MYICHLKPTRMNALKTIAIVGLAVLTISCGDTKKEGTVEPEVKTVETKFEHKAAKIEATFKDENSQTIFERYIALKTALINADAPRAGSDANDLMNLIANMAEVSTIQELKKIITSDDLEVQRAAFAEITPAMESILKEALEQGEIYKQYCPMAFGNTGGYWLSESKEIANPFFGDKMYRCGRIDAVIE